MRTQNLYYEVLGYPGWWIIPPIIMGLINLIIFLVFLLMGSGIMLPCLLLALGSVVPILVLGLGKLKLEFTADSFSYSAPGTGRQTYLREDIAEMEVIEYDFLTQASVNPFSHKNLIMGGQYALRVRTKGGKTIVLTTRRPKELRQFLPGWITGETPLDLNTQPAALDLNEQPVFYDQDLV
ncbi:MAG: hypothetical protein AAFN92_10475 [Bacteroidota bacterium]